MTFWNPTKYDRKMLNRGDWKMRRYNYKREGRLTEIICCCGRPIYLIDGKRKLTLSGSDHTCKRSEETVLQG